jgi:hypothetical protein
MVVIRANPHGRLGCARRRSGARHDARQLIVDRLLTMRSETVAVGCHRLPIGLFEPWVNGFRERA